MKRIGLQDIFDAAWQAFIVEGKPPAVDEFNTCVYLTNDGRKCAVGLCIPDGHSYQQGCMGFSNLIESYDMVSSQPLFDEQIHSMTGTQLNDFQMRLHDEWVDKESGGRGFSSKCDMERGYRRVAAEYGLTVPGEPV